MKVNIYYGGRGLIDDPTLYVMNKVQEVLEELRVNVERINLFEQKNAISIDAPLRAAACGRPRRTRRLTTDSSPGLYSSGILPSTAIVR